MTNSVTLLETLVCMVPEPLNSLESVRLFECTNGSEFVSRRRLSSLVGDISLLAVSEATLEAR